MATTPTITVTLNGKKAELSAGQHIADLLATKNLDPRVVMVELNEQAVRRDRFHQTLIHEGDAIEIVRMIAGG